MSWRCGILSKAIGTVWKMVGSVWYLVSHCITLPDKGTGVLASRLSFAKFFLDS